MNEQEQQYVKGFNHGYTLAKHKPELLQKISQNLKPVTDYTEGFINGKDEYHIERTSQSLDELDSLREESKGMGKDLEI